MNGPPKANAPDDEWLEFLKLNYVRSQRDHDQWRSDHERIDKLERNMYRISVVIALCATLGGAVAQLAVKYLLR